MRKSIIAIVVAAVSSVSSVSAFANAGADFVHSMASHQVSYTEAASQWALMSDAQRYEARKADKANGTNWTADFQDTHAVYARGLATATYNPSSHLDSNATDADRTAAQLQAIKDSVKDGVDGQPGKDGKDGKDADMSIVNANTKNINGLNGDVSGLHDTVNAIAKQVDENNARNQGQDLEQANRDRTANQHVTPTNGKDGAQGEKGEKGESVTGAAGRDGSNGVDGKAGANGRNGKDGVTTIRRELDTETKAVVLSHSRAISNNSQAIERNSQRIDRNAKAIAANSKAIKQVGAMATASANLHYNRAENGYAVAVGEYKGATAVAGGVQFNTSANTAVTVQASYDGDAVGASVGFHGSW